MTPEIRLLPYERHDGPTNMAIDEAMLLGVSSGPSLRFYGWSPAAASLGYFQPAALRPADLPWVRRSTGGATLVHDQELTYALALPPELLAGEPWMPRMHRIIRGVLVELGAKVEIVDTPRRLGDVLCFQQQTVGDLTAAGSKIVGSAQRKHRRGLLQHGAILLRTSRWTPQLPGLFESTGVEVSPMDLRHRLIAGFAAETGWSIVERDLSPTEREHVAELSHEKYASPVWNEKR